SNADWAAATHSSGLPVRLLGATRASGELHPRSRSGSTNKQDLFIFF
ncbi:MAG: hypothetical protein ACI9W4_001275, partial [Rhodothermales bacterium]